MLGNVSYASEAYDTLLLNQPLIQNSHIDNEGNHLVVWDKLKATLGSAANLAARLGRVSKDTGTADIRQFSPNRPKATDDVQDLPLYPFGPHDNEIQDDDRLAKTFEGMLDKFLKCSTKSEKLESFQTLLTELSTEEATSALSSEYEAVDAAKFFLRLIKQAPVEKSLGKDGKELLGQLKALLQDDYKLPANELVSLVKDARISNKQQALFTLAKNGGSIDLTGIAKGLKTADLPLATGVFVELANSYELEELSASMQQNTLDAQFSGQGLSAKQAEKLVNLKSNSIDRRVRLENDPKIGDIIGSSFEGIRISTKAINKLSSDAYPIGKQFNDDGYEPKAEDGVYKFNFTKFQKVLAQYGAQAATRELFTAFRVLELSKTMLQSAEPKSSSWKKDYAELEKNQKLLILILKDPKIFPDSTRNIIRRFVGQMQFEVKPDHELSPQQKDFKKMQQIFIANDTRHHLVRNARFDLINQWNDVYKEDQIKDLADIETKYSDRHHDLQAQVKILREDQPGFKIASNLKPDFKDSQWTSDEAANKFIDSLLSKKDNQGLADLLQSDEAAELQLGLQILVTKLKDFDDIKSRNILRELPASLDQSVESKLDAKHILELATQKYQLKAAHKQLEKFQVEEHAKASNAFALFLSLDSNAEIKERKSVGFKTQVQLVGDFSERIAKRSEQNTKAFERIKSLVTNNNENLSPEQQAVLAKTKASDLSIEDKAQLRPFMAEGDFDNLNLIVLMEKAITYIQTALSDREKS